MTEPTPSLLPCPFCGASARGYEIEPHQHSAALLALVPDMPKEHHGSYVIEGDCQCGSGLIGDNQAEVTARWNSRAPLKTAEGAYPALPEPVDQIAQADGFNVIGTADVFTAGQMRAYAAQAVAAQAPAAVAVPDERDAFEQAFIAEKLRVMDLDETDPAVQAIRKCHLQRYGNGDYPSLEAYFAWFAWQARAALAATPALPATEDSSAGDLSAPTDAEIIALNDGERFFSMSESRFGKEVNPHTQYHTGEPGYLQFARAVLARWGSTSKAQAEVQAEPVFGYVNTSTGQYFKDVDPCRKTNEGHWRTVYTAPQAQPADALDAVDQECLAIGRAINRAAGELPADGEIHIEIENGAGSVSVYEPALNDWRVIDSGDVFSAQINEAIDAAMAAAQEGGNAAKEA